MRVLVGGRSSRSMLGKVPDRAKAGHGGIVEVRPGRSMAPAIVDCGASESELNISIPQATRAEFDWQK